VITEYFEIASDNIFAPKNWGIEYFLPIKILTVASV